MKGLTQRQLTQLHSLLPRLERGLPLTPAQADTLAELRKAAPIDTDNLPALRRSVAAGLGGFGFEEAGA
jgi:hypothetical protein